MDYEKEYKEALERAKELIALLDKVKLKATQADIYEIFPELAESEDERTRKWIVNLLHELHYNQTSQPMALKAIEYLEKQKEQKPAESVGYPPRGKVYAIMNKLTDLSYSDRIPINSEEYQMINEITSDVCALLSADPEEPAEWSEEDETAFGDLMWCIEQATKSAKDENDLGNIWFAENWVKNRLKSLRPSWKPSEEQMKALYDMIPFIKSEGVPLEAVKPLESLYEDLKKL